MVTTRIKMCTLRTSKSGSITFYKKRKFKLLRNRNTLGQFLPSLYSSLLLFLLSFSSKNYRLIGKLGILNMKRLNIVYHSGKGFSARFCPSYNEVSWIKSSSKIRRIYTLLNTYALFKMMRVSNSFYFFYFFLSGSLL